MVVDGKVRNLWIRGRVTQTYPGKDGIIRQADVETSTGILRRRPVCKLAILDVFDCEHRKAFDYGQDDNVENHGACSKRGGANEQVFKRHEGEDVATQVFIDTPPDVVDVPRVIV